MGAESPALAESAQLAGLCHALYEHSPLPCLAAAGPGQLVEYLNPAFCRLLGEPLERLRGRSLGDLLPADGECAALARQVFQTGRPECHLEPRSHQPHPILWSFELWPLRAQGEVVGVMVQVTESALAHETKVAMNEALIVSSVRQHELAEEARVLNESLLAEIRQRRQAEENLRASAEQFRSLFAAAPMALSACDRAGIIQQYNARAVALLGREPVGGSEHYFEATRLWLPGGQLLPREQFPMAQALATGLATQSGEVALERPDGSRVPVQINCAPLKDEAGSVTGAIISFVDLTERKKLEQQAMRSQRLECIGTMAGGIAHDLNNSLGPILMSLHSLREMLPEPTCQDLLDILEKSAHRGAEMVRQILSFAHGVEGARAELGLRTLVREVEKIVRETFPRQIAIQTSVAPDLWPVLGDSTQLYPVLLNLCLNARDALPGGGQIMLSASNRMVEATHEGLSLNASAKPGRYVVLTVGDNGMGIPENILENIFDPFFTTKDLAHGNGLGLSTAQTIVKSHGGFFQVASEVGRGTTFQVFLPAKPALAPPEPRSPKPSSLRGQGELLLVVDDEAPMRFVTKQILETSGYRVVLACDGAEAVALYEARREEFAAVLTDMTMPVMDGPTAIRLLLDLNPRLSIIGASGLASSTYLSELAQLGIKHILCKPYSATDLLKMLQEVLAEARTARETELR